MKHLAIYYIATSNYKMGFEHFKKNLKYFYPEFKKTVMILSDGLTEWNNIVEDNITYKTYHIDHFPWPIITLFKMKYIYDHRITCDYVCYFNGNLQYNPNYNTSLNKIDLTKLNVTRHAFSNENDEYDNKNFENVSQQSIAYINKPYKYVQGGFFIGPSDIVYKMCEDVCKICEIDLSNNIIPQWHDESYLNKWCEDNAKLIKKERLIKYAEFDHSFPFSIIETIDKDRRTSIRYYKDYDSILIDSKDDRFAN